MYFHKSLFCWLSKVLLVSSLVGMPLQSAFAYAPQWRPLAASQAEPGGLGRFRPLREEVALNRQSQPPVVAAQTSRFAHRQSVWRSESAAWASRHPQAQPGLRPDHRQPLRMRPTLARSWPIPNNRWRPVGVDADFNPATGLTGAARLVGHQNIWRPLNLSRAGEQSQSLESEMASKVRVPERYRRPIKFESSPRMTLWALMRQPDYLAADNRLQKLPSWHHFAPYAASGLRTQMPWFSHADPLPMLMQPYSTANRAVWPYQEVKKTKGRGGLPAVRQRVLADLPIERLCADCDS